MLVLSRHRGESIVIGTMLVTVIDIRGDKVRLSIAAPKEIPVHRLEVFQALCRENGGTEPDPVPYQSSWKLPDEPSGLVLSRRRDETIVINTHIRIVIVDIRGDKVRLGIEAPQDIPVHRREVYDAKQREAGQPPSLPT